MCKVIGKVGGLLFLLVFMVLSSCIPNDIPYPTVYGNFTGFEVRGQLKAAEINTSTREITVELSDTVDLKSVYVMSYTLTENTTIEPELGATLDLSSPQYFTLHTYQDYKWKIQAKQTIERAFVLADDAQQIGEAVWDEENFSVVAYVPTTVPVNPIKIKELKLGPSNAVMTPAASAVTDFSTPQYFTIKYRNVEEKWKVMVLQREITVSTTFAIGWVSLGWFKGEGLSGADNGFEYKKSTENEWQKASPTEPGKSVFEARVTGLLPQTEYQCRAYSNDNKGEVITFTTDPMGVLPNASFDDWHLEDSKGNQNTGNIYCPWISGGTSFWDTGNKGATTVGESNSAPSTDTQSGSGKAAKLNSVFAGVGPLGKFAAGNIFAGEYLRTDGTNGVLSFGRPFESRFVKLEGYYKYTSAPVNYTSKSDPNLTAMNGKPDTCCIYVALTDWAAPLEIRTKPSERSLFDKNDPGVIAYGQFVSAETVTQYTKFTIQLDYKAYNRKPKYLVLVATSSKYGDYFTGGSGSVMMLDALKLVYE